MLSIILDFNFFFLLVSFQLHQKRRNSLSVVMSRTSDKSDGGKVKGEMEVDVSEGASDLDEGRNVEVRPNDEVKEEQLKLDMEAGKGIVTPCRCELVRLYGVLKPKSKERRKTEVVGDDRMETGESGSDPIVISDSEDGKDD